MTKTKLALFLLFSAFTCNLLANIDAKINSTQTDIKNQKSKEKLISKKLSSIANDIKKEEQKLTKINRDIKNIKQKIVKQNQKSKIKKGELKKINTLYNDLVKREKDVNKKMTDILSKGISLKMIANGDSDRGMESIDNIVMKEVYNSYSKILKDKFSKTKIRYSKLTNNIKIVKKELDKIKFKLNGLKAQIKRYDKLKNQKSKTIKNLDNQRGAYLKKLNKARNQSLALGDTLKKLNITKTKRKKTIIKEIKATPSQNASVRQIGSSYQTSALVKYRGPKTISPLDSYTISQNFGTYTDPIYKMKIFNESVILRAKSKNSRVKNVLDGKIIYAAKTSMLEHVVIVKNRDNIHTIFAHLSQIAPTIKVGKKIPKGYVLGRVSRELTFEVTQNEKHINPMRLIK